MSIKKFDTVWEGDVFSDADVACCVLTTNERKGDKKDLISGVFSQPLMKTWMME